MQQDRDGALIALHTLLKMIIYVLVVKQNYEQVQEEKEINWLLKK